MADLTDIPQILLQYRYVPGSVLRSSTIKRLSLYLNPPRNVLSSTGVITDWRGLAEELGFDTQQMNNFEMGADPTKSVISEWTTCGSDATVGALLDALCTIERFDILRDEQFEKNIARDKMNWDRQLQRQAERDEPLQVQEVDSLAERHGTQYMDIDEYKCLTISEVETGIPEYFDAFVCYTPDDFKFVQEMMQKLEGVHGLKLCILSRDLTLGSATYTATAKLISERCRKMIIILSPSFMNSPECDFQTKFAFSLAPGAKQRKLIPVIIKQCQVPKILNHICLIDYTRCDVAEWFWQRLAKSVSREPTTVFTSCPSRGLESVTGSFEDVAGPSGPSAGRVSPASSACSRLSDVSEFMETEFNGQNLTTNNSFSHLGIFATPSSAHWPDITGSGLSPAAVGSGSESNYSLASAPIHFSPSNGIQFPGTASSSCSSASFTSASSGGVAGATAYSGGSQGAVGGEDATGGKWKSNQEVKKLKTTATATRSEHQQQPKTVIEHMTETVKTVLQRRTKEPNKQ